MEEYNANTDHEDPYISVVISSDLLITFPY